MWMYGGREDLELAVEADAGDTTETIALSIVRDLVDMAAPPSGRLRLALSTRPYRPGGFGCRVRLRYKWRRRRSASMQRVVFAVFVFCLPACAFAAGGGPCLQLTKQQEMNACIADALRKADADLNTVYGQMTGKLDVSGKRNLVAAERAWIAFRDAECDLRSGYDTVHLENNGTIAPFLVGQCKLERTEERAAELRKQLRCPGGDLSCSP